MLEIKTVTTDSFDFNLDEKSLVITEHYSPFYRIFENLVWFLLFLMFVVATAITCTISMEKYLVHFILFSLCDILFVAFSVSSIVTKDDLNAVIIEKGRIRLFSSKKRIAFEIGDAPNCGLLYGLGSTVRGVNRYNYIFFSAYPIEEKKLKKKLSNARHDYYYEMDENPFITLRFIQKEDAEKAKELIDDFFADLQRE